MFEANTTFIGKVNDQNALNINIKIGTDKKIYFESTDNLSTPSLSKVGNEEISAYLDLLTIEKDLTD